METEADIKEEKEKKNEDKVREWKKYKEQFYLLKQVLWLTLFLFLFFASLVSCISSPSLAAFIFAEIYVQVKLLPSSLCKRSTVSPCLCNGFI